MRAPPHACNTGYGEFVLVTVHLGEPFEARFTSEFHNVPSNTVRELGASAFKRFSPG